MSYRAQYIVGIVVAFVGIIMAAVNTVAQASPDNAAMMGLSRGGLLWIAVGLMITQGLSTALPSWRRPPAKEDDAGPRGDPDPMPRDE